MRREFESNGNPGVARQLLQTGIRSCSSDPSLWVEFYRMVRRQVVLAASVPL